MANQHPRENQLFETIRTQRIKVPLYIWDLIYNFIGDDITAITHIASYHHPYGEPVPVADVKKMLGHTQSIRGTMDKILHPDKISANETIRPLEKIKARDTRLHPVITELFTHYISNDVYGINMIVSFYLDPLDENPISVDDTQKILDKIASMRHFLDRLSRATNQVIKNKSGQK
jgi:hypothetical protein